MLVQKLKEAINSATKSITSIEIVCSDKGFIDLVKNLEMWHETDKDNFYTVCEGNGNSFSKVFKKKYSQITIWLQNGIKPVTILVDD